MPPTKQELRDSFVEDVQQIYNLYNSLSKHTTNTEGYVLAEQTVVSLTVALESFVSEVLVALISERSDLFLKNLSEDMKKDLLRIGHSHQKVLFLAHDGAKKIKADDLRDIILDDGDNLAFPETRMLTDFVRKNLPRAIAFDLTPDDEMFIDLLKGTRNLCAHHSQKSAKTLNSLHQKYIHDHKVNESDVCQTLGKEEDLTVRNIGNYLKRQIPDSAYRDRIEFVATYLRGMAFRWIK